jgi:hypothetical protein
MSTDERIRNRPNFRTPLLILGIAMTFFYIVLGSLLLLKKDFLPTIPDTFRNIFAVMILVYGSYRGWRVYADLKQS